MIFFHDICQSTTCTCGAKWICRLPWQYDDIYHLINKMTNGSLNIWQEIILLENKNKKSHLTKIGTRVRLGNIVWWKEYCFPIFGCYEKATVRMLRMTLYDQESLQSITSLFKLYKTEKTHRLSCKSSLLRVFQQYNGYFLLQIPVMRV